MTHEFHSTPLQLDDKIKSFLQDFGWFEGRCVDIDETQVEINKRGFQWNCISENILRQLDGVSFKSNHGGVSWFSFGHRECFHTFRSDHLTVLETLANEPDPCPIGRGEGYLLFAFPSGKYALLQEQWWFLAFSDSFGAILDAMIFRDLSGCCIVEDVVSYLPDW